MALARGVSHWSKYEKKYCRGKVKYGLNVIAEGPLHNSMFCRFAINDMDNIIKNIPDLETMTNWSNETEVAVLNALMIQKKLRYYGFCGTKYKAIWYYFDRPIYQHTDIGNDSDNAEVICYQKYKKYYHFTNYMYQDGYAPYKKAVLDSTGHTCYIEYNEDGTIVWDNIL